MIESGAILAVQKEMAEARFFNFVRLFWSVIIKEEPVYNWHIEFLCDELQKITPAIVAREPKPYDVIINIPPGTTKSTICTVMYPAWLWTQDATLRVITNSYSSDLSTEHAVKSRDIILSDKFRQLWPEVKLRGDKAAKQNYENALGGARYTTSTGGTITGKHAHVIINDDPLNPSQAASEADRKSANEHTKTLSSRKVDKENTPTITVMQRVHENDVTGYLLSKKKEQIRHICLPAEVSEDVRPVELKDRYIDGLLDPKRMPAHVLAEAKVDLGSYGYANQYGQKSSPQEGGILKTDWFGIIDWKQDYAALVWNTAVDPAYSEDTANDESGMMQFAKHENDILIRFSEGIYKEFPELVKYTQSFAELHGYSPRSIIFVEPKASGKSLVQTIKRSTTINIKEDVPPFKDKVARVSDISPICEAGRVKLIRGSWNDAFLDQVRTFPNSKQDGQIDTLVIAINNSLKKKSGSWGSSRQV
jgi:predicted phage terminase large subunit-like protein